MTTNTIDQTITDIAAKIKPEMQVGDAGIVTLPKDIYERLLPDDVTMDMVKKVQQHNANMLAGTGQALGEVGIEAMVADKNLDQVSIEYPVHKDIITGTFNRTKMVPDGNGGQQAKYGVLGMNYKTSGAAGSKGALKKVRTHLADKAKQILAE